MVQSLLRRDSATDEWISLPNGTGFLSALGLGNSLWRWNGSFESLRDGIQDFSLPPLWLCKRPGKTAGVVKRKEEFNMYNARGYGRGSGMGYGRGMGYGFRGSSPPWPYVGIGRGGLPRCQAYGGYGYVPPAAPYPPGPSAYGWGTYGAPPSPEEEVRFLKDRAGMIRMEIEAVDARLKELEKEQSSGGEG